MATLIERPVRVPGAGNPPKTIEEFIGRVSTGSPSVSVARMKSPAGWTEPGQSPEFDEYTLVLEGALHVETHTGSVMVRAGQALIARKGEWVKYSTPEASGAEYIAICMPAFSLDLAHRDEHA